MGSKIRRAIATVMLVLMLVVSAVTFYLRENSAWQSAATPFPAPDKSHHTR